jgi:chromosome transmission fidelity protein 1
MYSMCFYSQGSILFAVVGAKLSEGINFADDMARGALLLYTPRLLFLNAKPVFPPITLSCHSLRYVHSPVVSLSSFLIFHLPAGIPYPNSQSAELKERMTYLKTTAAPGRPAGSPDAGQVLCAFSSSLR